MKNAVIALVALVALAAVVGGFYALNSHIYNEKQGSGLPSDFKEATFFVSGEPVALSGGVAEVATNLSGGAPSIVRYFGDEVAHDLDGDGVEDMAFLVTQEAGGSGTFFYLVGALAREGGYEGTHAAFIGDRIAPQTVEPGEGRTVVVNYADRAQGEPMSARPSVGKSLRLLLDPATLQFGEVVEGFEGESR